MGLANLYVAQPLGMYYVSNHAINCGSYPFESNLEAYLGIKIANLKTISLGNGLVQFSSSLKRFSETDVTAILDLIARCLKLPP